MGCFCGNKSESSLSNTHTRGTKAYLVRSYRLQSARLKWAFRTSGQCGSDLHQRLRKLRWTLRPEISRCLLVCGCWMCTQVIMEEITAETNRDLSLLHLVFDCVGARYPDIQPVCLVACLFVLPVGSSPAEFISFCVVVQSKPTQ